MATISSSGIGSGLDVTTLVSQLMAVERKPITLLDTKIATNQAKLSSYGSVKSAMALLQTAVKALSTPATFSPAKASVADATILTASASSTAVPGTYDVEVQSLAQSQKLMMYKADGTGYADTGTTVVGQGTITIDFGTYSTANPPVFSANDAKETVSIEIGEGNQTLGGIRDKINAANAGVNASIVNDGNGYHLSLTSTDSGARNAMKISVAAPTAEGASIGDLGQLAYDAQMDTAATYESDGTTLKTAAIIGSKMVQNVQPQDAVIVVDNITFTKQSNTITDAIQGVTLNLEKTKPGSTDKVSVTSDKTNVKTAVDAFVKAYNDVNKAIADASAYDPSTGKSAALTGDSTLRSIQTQLRGLFTTAVSGAPSNMTMLSDVGISFQKDGTLAADETKFAAALADPSKDMSKLFASTGSVQGYAWQADVLIGKLLSPVGILVSKTNNVNATIKDIGVEQASITARLVSVEARYRSQFTALDVMMSSMTTTSNFLTQQFASFSNSA